ncbi:MAG: anti-sigma factor family protein [Acidobacteriota bacterium]
MKYDCPEEGMIQAYADDELDELQKSKIDAHLRSCEHCSKLIEQVKTTDSWLCTAITADSYEMVHGRISSMVMKTRWMIFTIMICLAATMGSWVYSAALLSQYSFFIAWWGNGLQWMAISNVANSLWAFIIEIGIYTYRNSDPTLDLVRALSQWSLVISLICIYMIFRRTGIKSKRLFGS